MISKQSNKIRKFRKTKYNGGSGSSKSKPKPKSRPTSPSKGKKQTKRNSRRAGKSVHSPKKLKHTSITTSFGHQAQGLGGASTPEEKTIKTNNQLKALKEKTNKNLRSVFNKLWALKKNKN